MHEKPKAPARLKRTRHTPIRSQRGHSTTTTLLIVPREFWLRISRPHLTAIQHHLLRQLQSLGGPQRRVNASTHIALSVTAPVKGPVCEWTGKVEYRMETVNGKTQLCACYEMKCSDGTIEWDCYPVDGMSTTDATAPAIAPPPTRWVDNGEAHPL
ncbi:MAG: hypothetical protein HYR85_20770 [Planctomycetes bacterium]|nr:hypothetical protein [Planctomycetota bacterium]MBI3846929.1 hypothetical protein [Planctomycetota bacterium]